MASITSTSAFGSLAVSLAQAITFLTRSLIVRYSATTIIKLQLALEANLTAQFETSWVPEEPLRGSGRRCLTLSPACNPPRAVYNACKSAGVEWSEWFALLGGLEFDLFIDPGCVSIRYGNWETGKVGQFFTIWSETRAPEAKALKMLQQQKEAQLQAQLKADAAARVAAILAQGNKTLAQQVIEADQDDEDEIFVMIADEMREPTWLTPILTQFPAVPSPPRSISPSSISSAISRHSRSSSCSSSSGFSFSSHGTTDSYGSSATTTLSTGSKTSTDSQQTKFKMSRRERARQARVFIDTSKTEVTPYDGGKTTVLTGGVMLGGAAPKPKFTQNKTKNASGNWRASRV